MPRLLGTCGALLAICCAAAAAPAAAQQDRVIGDGQAEYERHCQACHGDSGRGDGQMAKILVIPPADLTVIAEANGGSFPFWQIYAAIDGSQEVSGHETFQMPEYWARFREEETKPGYAAAHLRVLVLTHYLESLQAQ